MTYQKYVSLMTSMCEEMAQYVIDGDIEAAFGIVPDITELMRQNQTHAARLVEEEKAETRPAGFMDGTTASNMLRLLELVDERGPYGRRH